MTVVLYFLLLLGRKTYVSGGTRTGDPPRALPCCTEEEWRNVVFSVCNPELQTRSFWGSGGMQNKNILFVCRRLLTVNYLKKQKKTLLIFNLKFLDSPLHFKIYIPPLCVILSNKNFEWSLDDDSLW